MQYPISFILFLAFLSVNLHKENKPLHENIDCNEKLMKRAYNAPGEGGAIPAELNKGFIILADTNKATGLICNLEATLRKNLTIIDTPDLERDYTYEEWKSMPANKKLEKLEEARIQIKKGIGYVHKKNDNVVRIYNNTTETVKLQVQDGSFIGILQGLNKDGKWLPVQYWQWSGCGNSYHVKRLPPKATALFTTHIPNSGNYETRLRFKIMGIDKFYYSNEFIGKIDYCEFEGTMERFRSKLDSVENMN